MTKKLLLLLAPGLLASGCASMVATSGPPCTGRVCPVDVVVDGACRITVRPENLPVAPGNKNALIQWSITGGEFTANGIAFKGATGSEFHSPTHSPQRITYVDKHDVVGVTYPYTVTVVRGGRPCPPLDPTIMN